MIGVGTRPANFDREGLNDRALVRRTHFLQRVGLIGGFGMEYDFRKIEKAWKEKWKETDAYRVDNPPALAEPFLSTAPAAVPPKCYVLDMFPYPSGAGLHVGHPLGYIASDIYARFKRLKGFRVLHPMGYDAFGLPAEQYALEHGVHPLQSTETNIANFRRQLDNIGFSFDWSREIRTSDKSFYRWTQWIFLRLFNSWYNRRTGRAEPIHSLAELFESEGNRMHSVPNTQFQLPSFEAPVPGLRTASFTAEQWRTFDEGTRQAILMEYRLAYCGYGEVNWCEALGTVLANDEVINGLSERGGYPVVKKTLRQWYMRISEYADRLLEGLERVDFSEAMKEMQSNWIGRSYGADIDFYLQSDRKGPFIRVFTTRPDTIFGVDFLVLAPEHELIIAITAPDQQAKVEDYMSWVRNRTERERMAEKKISGCFTGAFAVHPFTGKPVPVWIAEYVLAGYGTGAIMGVPCGDERDFRFARHFGIPITNIIGSWFSGQEANATKDAILENSSFLDDIVMRDAIEVVSGKLEEAGLGMRKVNYKMRDAAFSRQRYWGEPIPIVWKDDIPWPLDDSLLPLELPHVENYRPGPEGEGPLANMPEWTARQLETNTMPGYAGSSWYFLRFMDPSNDQSFCDRRISDYWGPVDLYVGGTEHAVGHLLYSRMWTKVLFDLGYIGFDEPYRKLLNQGMIQGSSRFVYRIDPRDNELAEEQARLTPLFASHGMITDASAKTLEAKVAESFAQFLPEGEPLSFRFTALHVDVNIVDGLELDPAAFARWKAEYRNARFIFEDGTLSKPGTVTGGKYICGTEVEKMSKSKFNTVNPDDLVDKFGADTFRMYEMFLGPIDQSKPWDTKGIEGVHRFLKKLWRLFYEESKGSRWVSEPPTAQELKVLHRAIRKVEEDTERFAFNTAVSALMIAVNDLTDLGCHKLSVLQKLLIIMAPYAPHICEELAHQTGFAQSILQASFPEAQEKYLKESSKNYPVAINGKTRLELAISLDATQEEVEEIVLSNTTVKKWLEGKSLKKLIYVKGKMINVVA